MSDALFVEILSTISPTAPLLQTPLTLEVADMRTSAMGGPIDATITATGALDDLLDVRRWLGLPVAIRDDASRKIWWGQIEAAELSMQAIVRSWTLRDVVNRYQVVSTLPSVSGRGESQVTAWIQDDTSVARYGIYEERRSMSDVTEAMVSQAIASLLVYSKDPRHARAVRAPGAASAKLLARGWWLSLDQQYYSQSAGYTAHAVNGNTQHKIGLGFTGTTIGFRADKRTIHDLQGRFTNIKKDDQIYVSGGTNTGVHSVEQGTGKTATSYTAATISYGTENSRSRITDSANGLTFVPTGTNFTIAGSGAGNNGTRIAKGAASDGSYLEVDQILTNEGPGVSLTISRVPSVYTATTITITTGAHHKIYDSARGLGNFNAGDMIKITGGVNTGYFFVKSGAADGAWVEVDRAVTTAAAGASITIERGNSIVLVSALTDADPGASITVQIAGDAMAQRWTPSGQWTIGAIALRIRKVGNPTDSVRISHWSDSSGTPGTSLDTVLVDAADIDTSWAWIEAPLTNTQTVSAGTYYHVVTGRLSGTLDPTNYYEIALDTEAGYAAGTYTHRVNGAWVARSPDADMPFRAIGYREITAQIADIVAASGQFIEGVDILTTSGIVVPQFQDGKLTALDVLTKLLDAATAGGKRLLATITPERFLRITEESPQPTAGTHTYGLLEANGRLVDPAGEYVPPALTPVGIWVDVRDSLLDDAPEFLERVQWRKGALAPTYEWRGQRSPWDQTPTRRG